jgi:hypothetical protein
MLQMSHFQVQLKFFSKLVQQMQQRHRIRPAGDGDENAIAVRQKVFFLNEIFDFVFHRLDREHFPPPIHPRNKSPDKINCNPSYDSIAWQHAYEGN